jgi:hypothetical protein
VENSGEERKAKRGEFRDVKLRGHSPKAKTSEIDRKVEIKEGAEKPTRPLALVRKNSESLANLKRG